MKHLCVDCHTFLVMAMSIAMRFWVMAQSECVLESAMLFYQLRIFGFSLYFKSLSVI